MYKEYGYYYHPTQNIQFKGQAGAAQMTELMENLRKSPPDRFCGIDTAKMTDYLKPEITGLPRSNVLKLELKDGSVIIVRPSGTEPKLKIYYTCIGEDLSAAVKLQEQLQGEFNSFLGL